MPVMDSFEATKKIREIEKENGAEPTFIIVLTANATNVWKLAWMILCQSQSSAKSLKTWLSAGLKRKISINAIIKLTMKNMIRLAGILSFVAAVMFATNGFAIRHHSVIGSANPAIHITRIPKEGDTAPQAPSISGPDKLQPSVNEPLASRIKGIYAQYNGEPKLKYLQNPIKVMSPRIVVQKIPIFTLAMSNLLELDYESGDIQNQLGETGGNFNVYNLDPIFFFMLKELELSGYNLKPIVIKGIETIKSESEVGVLRPEN